MDQESNFTSNKRIIDIKPGDKNIDIKLLILNKLSSNKLKSDAKITQFLVADHTGSIHCNFFDEIGDKLNEGDIIFLKCGYASVFKNQLILYASKLSFGQLIKIGEFFMTYTEQPNMSLFTWHKEKDEKTGLDVFVKDQ
jgi:hypothetical protein